MRATEELYPHRKSSLQICPALVAKHFRRCCAVAMQSHSPTLFSPPPPSLPTATSAVGISRLDLDHVAILGNTLPLIAGEKAGIFKVCSHSPSRLPASGRGSKESGDGLSSESLRLESLRTRSRKCSPSTSPPVRLPAYPHFCCPFAPLPSPLLLHSSRQVSRPQLHPKRRTPLRC